jgi:carbohydrate-binding DOMON domain-containing protein
MKPAFPRLASLSMLFVMLVITIPYQANSIFGFSQNGIARQSNLLQVSTPTDTPTNTPAPTNTPTLTATNNPTNTPAGSFIRPQIGVGNYRTNPVNVQYGEDFKLFVRLRNEGHANAYNVQVSFTSADFIPL